MTIRPKSWKAELAIAALLLGGCAIGPEYHPPAAATASISVAYKEVPDNGQPADPALWKPAQPQDAMLRGKWWEIFGDPQLNELEAQLDINNQTIKQYFENFMEARALIGQAQSELYPAVTTSPSATRSRTPGFGGGAGAAAGGGQGAIANLYSLPIDVSWEPDLWGRVRNAIRESEYNAQLSEADLENEKLTEQASLAMTLFELRGQDSLQKVYDDTAIADRKALELTQAAYKTGIGDRISVIEAANTLENAQAAATNVGIERAQYEHAIAVLIGKSPSGFSIPAQILEATPPAIPVGIPSQLLERRPDIAAAERGMAAANAEIGIADAAYYPTLTLGAEGGLESPSLSSLFTWPARFWSVGPSVSYAIYDAGLRAATVAQYVAAYNVAVANYRQTVLTGFQQVEDSLASLRILSRQIAQQQEAVKSAELLVKLEMNRYQTGVDPYINVVTAQTTFLSDQLNFATLRIEQMNAAVELIEALGGGWDRSQLPSKALLSQDLLQPETQIAQ